MRPLGQSLVNNLHHWPDAMGLMGYRTTYGVGQTAETAIELRQAVQATVGGYHGKRGQDWKVGGFGVF